MSTSDFLTIEEEAIHNNLVAQFGGPHGLRDAGPGRSGISGDAAQDLVLRKESWTRLPPSWRASPTNHPFMDGNKRVSFFATATFLRLNGLRIVCDDLETHRHLVGLLETGSFRFFPSPGSGWKATRRRCNGRNTISTPFSVGRSEHDKQSQNVPAGRSSNRGFPKLTRDGASGSTLAADCLSEGDNSMRKLMGPAADAPRRPSHSPGAANSVTGSSHYRSTPRQTRVGSFVRAAGIVSEVARRRKGPC